jgi:hypothetical protein
MTLIDLDSLINPARLPRVKLFGREVVVHPMSGAAAHRVAIVYAKPNDDGTAMLAALLDVAKTSVPDLTSEEVERLSLEQLVAVVQLSRNGVAEVEKMLSEAAEKN